MDGNRFSSSKYLILQQWIFNRGTAVYDPIILWLLFYGHYAIKHVKHVKQGYMNDENRDSRVTSSATFFFFATQSQS